LKLAEATGPEFEPGSLIPARHWTPVTKIPDSVAIPTAWTSFSGDAPLKDNIAMLHLDGITGDGGEVLERRIDRLCHVLSSRPETIEHKGRYFAVGAPSSLATTIHPVSRKYVGLHVDSFERRIVSELRQARNRLCVNLGPYGRWFLFSPVETTDVAAACGLGPSAILNTIGFRQYAVSADLPIFRLRMEPGDAYIAPTERLLHDGQAENSERTCIYTVMGYFDNTMEARDLSAV
jgi:hypothetical protein